MLNTDDFIKRLEFIMEHFGLSASSFADKISVQRSSISHLLSGRNKPSLDFIMKILDIFPELNLYWLLDGTGSFLKNEKEEMVFKKAKNSPTPTSEFEKSESTLESKIEIESDEKEKNSVLFSGFISQSSSEKELDRIVIFYTDGTFEDYKPSSKK